MAQAASYSSTQASTGSCSALTSILQQHDWQQLELECAMSHAVKLTYGFSMLLMLSLCPADQALNARVLMRVDQLCLLA